MRGANYPMLFAFGHLGSMPRPFSQRRRRGSRRRPGRQGEAKGSPRQEPWRRAARTLPMVEPIRNKPRQHRSIPLSDRQIEQLLDSLDEADAEFHNKGAADLRYPFRLNNLLLRLQIRGASSDGSGSAPSVKRPNPSSRRGTRRTTKSTHSWIDSSSPAARPAVPRDRPRLPRRPDATMNASVPAPRNGGAPAGEQRSVVGQTIDRSRRCCRYAAQGGGLDSIRYSVFIHSSGCRRQ